MHHPCRLVYGQILTIINITIIVVVGVLHETPLSWHGYILLVAFDIFFFGCTFNSSPITSHQSPVNGIIIDDKDHHNFFQKHFRLYLENLTDIKNR